MVSKEKENIFNWFKDLNPRRRIDYMCGLLHLCLPMELRFIGTVLEDIAKKDFNHLRDAENKANNPSELPNIDSQSFGNPHFRAKMQINLTLMHSADGSCADIIFKILEKQFNSLTNYLNNEIVMEEILTILTIACHHPAFKIHQKLRLAEVLKNTEDHGHRQWDNHTTYPMHPPKNFQHQIPSSIPVSSSRVPHITFIDAKSICREEKKSGPLYEMHIYWSNGETREIYMTHSKLLELHKQIFNRFPEMEKLQTAFHDTAAQCRRPQEPKDKRAALMSNYLREHLSSAHHVLASDIVTQAFQNGKLIHLPMHMVPAANQSFFHPAYHENRYYTHYPENVRYPYLPHAIVMPATGLSSSTSSPANSRSSSPSVTINNSRNIKAVAEKGANHNKVKSGLQQQAVGDVEPHVEIRQLLKLLGLEKYWENLANLTVQEVYSMSADELTKLGLPHDAQMKLSRLEQPKHNLQEVNGLYGSDMKYDRVMHSYPSWQSQGHMSPDSGQQVPMPYPLHLVYSQVPPLPPNDNSPSASELCTPSLSPALHSMTDSPPSLASPTSVYLEEKNLKNHQVDSSGSEDDKVIAGPDGNETSHHRSRGPAPQQSISLPLLNHNASSLGSLEKGKVTTVPVSLSAPVMNSDVTREAGTPPMVPVGVPMVNGFAPESPLIAANVIPQVLHQQHRYRSAQPTHTRMHKNVINMPCPDLTAQPPPPTPNLNKSNGAIMHHSMLYPMMPPNIPGNHAILHTQQPTNGGAPQQLPSGQSLLPHSMATDNGGNMGTLPFISTIVPAANFMPQHSRSILTSVSNSTVVITTTQSHPSGQQPIAASHSPSPVASSVPADQTQINYIHSNAGEVVEIRHEESTPNSINKGSPPSHNNSNTVLSQMSSKTGPGSNTPSPPLAPKQTMPCITCDASTLHQSMYPPPCYIFPPFGNGVTMAPYSNPHQQSSLQHYANGINHELYLPRYSLPGQYFYGNQPFTNHHIHHNTNNSNSSHHTTGNNNSSGNNSSSNNKSTCYNCGQAGHKGNECKESPMDSMTNSFKLNIKPKTESE